MNNITKISEISYQDVADYIRLSELDDTEINTLNNLINIYKLLTEVSTKGEDTLRMAYCLQTFQNEIIQLQKINNKKEE